MSLGSLGRIAWQPLRPFLAGTKLTNYVLAKHGQDEEDREKEKRASNKISRMLHMDTSLSPPPTPVDLSSSVSLVSPSQALSTAATPPRPSSPEFTYDGTTFTAKVSQYFAVAPSSPPESDLDNEVSLFSDDLDDLQKLGAMVNPSSVVSGRTSSLGSTDGYIDSDLAEAAIHAVQSEPTLATAVTSVLQTGSMTPLIKEELKCTIQSKRIKSGKGELQITKEKKKHEKLTEEEEYKRARRRERNKIAAQKCRDKKSQLALELQQEIEDLEDRNSGLRIEMKSLNKEIEQLRSMLIRHDMYVKHDKSTQCGHMLAKTQTVKAIKVKASQMEEVASTEPPAKRQKTKRGAQKHN